MVEESHFTTGELQDVPDININRVWKTNICKSKNQTHGWGWKRRLDIWGL